MNILIVGSGAREHAIAAALCRSQQAPQLFCFGDTLNPGIKHLVTHYRIGGMDDITAITRFAVEKEIHLVVIGPAIPLEKGLADSLWDNNIPVIGPKQQLAKIETSKGYARDLMQKYTIPGLPRYKRFGHDNESAVPANVMTFKAFNQPVYEEIEAYLKALGEGNYVVKADGLMHEKGVKVAGDHLSSMAEATFFCSEIFAKGQSVVIEEKLIGQEFSFMAFSDGERLAPMPIVQDHKRAFVDDKGPNTGGMGSYSDANHSLPFLTQHDVDQAWSINEAIISAITAETHERYIGILYGSFIATAKGVFVIEFNARFGDPEVLNVLTILESDFVAVCQSMVNANMLPTDVRFAKQATVCKYAAPRGYPDAPIRDVPIDICAVKNKSNLYLSSVNLMNGKIYATGSRTAAYVGVADTLYSAEKIAEREVCGIGGPLFHREDIGTERLIQHRVDAMNELRNK